MADRTWKYCTSCPIAIFTVSTKSVITQSAKRLRFYRENPQAQLAKLFPLTKKNSRSNQDNLGRFQLLSPTVQDAIKVWCSWFQKSRYEVDACWKKEGGSYICHFRIQGNHQSHYWVPIAKNKSVLKAAPRSGKRCKSYRREKLWRDLWHACMPHTPRMRKQDVAKTASRWRWG